MSDVGDSDAIGSTDPIPVDWNALGKARPEPLPPSPRGRRWMSDPEVAWGCVGAIVFLQLVSGVFVWPEWIFQTFGRRAYVIQLPDDPAPPSGIPAGDLVRYGFRDGHGRTWPLRRDQILLRETTDRQGRHVVYLLPELEYVWWAPSLWRAPHREPIVPKNDGSIDRFDVYIGSLILHGACAAALVAIGVVALKRRGGGSKPATT